MNNKLSWHSIDREQLPHILINIEDDRELSGECLQADLHKNSISLAYDAEEQTHTQPPSVIVLRDEIASDVFSWLKVYTPEIFPLSQITRVISLSDWRITKNQPRLRHYQATNYQWACLTLGEMLAQGDSEAEISSIPLSRANACFTSAIAKTAIIYQNPELLDICAKRLVQLEKDVRFVKRIVAIELLMPIWDQIEKPCLDNNGITDILNDLYMVHINIAGSIGKYLLPRLEDHQNLRSDSIEIRVIAFNEIIQALTKLSVSNSQDIYISAFLAAAAFLVGRGTSHLFLLRKFSKQYPTVFVWFGLFAARAGAASWDPDWLRATKSIGRSLQQKPDWSTPMQVDLCWAEFSWISSKIERKRIFSDLQKLYPKVLSIEIFPGASCQFRLANTEQATTESQIVEQYTVSSHNYELQKTLADLASLAIRANIMFESEIGLIKPHFTLNDNSTQKKYNPRKGARFQQKQENDEAD
ncbi:hypothetical protein [Pseudomonas syringae]|uniref:hypothetical protein n=1 Tax=Pseudomonas syringae TaxID=317 RepID=UPI0003523E0B|nr:hypothetical protein [Pseudomonas syringae]EPF64257.1 Hypothetical protein PssSM_0092 [Pseudomonas syringae pv. syringae SM]